MTDHQRIQTEHAPAAIGPYSQAIKVDRFLYTAGQVGIDPRTGKLVEGGVEVQTRRALNNLTAILEAAGYTFADVVKTTVFLTSMSDFTTVNEIYRGYFATQEPPARSTVAVAGLPLGAQVEIECVAIKSQE